MSITVKIDAGRIASVPQQSMIIADNNDRTITFDIDAASGFDLASEKTAVLITARGKLPDISFSGMQIAIPRLTASDGGMLFVGLSQGDIKTTSSAYIRILPSIFSKAHGRIAPDPDAPQDYDVLPAAEDLSLADEIVVNDKTAGKRERATLQQLRALIGGGGKDHVYPVTIEETTHAEILAAWGDNKLPFCLDSGVGYICMTCNASKAVFVSIDDSAKTVEIISVTSANVWNSATLDVDAASRVAISQGRRRADKIMISDENGDLTLSDTLPGTPMAATAAAGTNTTQIATTAFVQAAFDDDADIITVTAMTSGGVTTMTIPKTLAEFSAAMRSRQNTKILYYLSETSYIGFGLLNVVGSTVYLGAIADDYPDTGERRLLLVPLSETNGALTGTLTVIDLDVDVSAKADKPKYTTLTIAVADWQTSGNAYACSKTVTGLTANSIVWLSYSDTEAEFTEAQSANTLTFTVETVPSAAITVNVAFIEGVSL